MSIRPISAIHGSEVTAIGREPRQPPVPSTLPARDAASGRALVTLEPSAPSEPAPAIRAQASFLAHLIATDRQEPQTRARRRAEPEDAIAAYAAATAGTPPAAGQRLARST